MDSNKNRSSYSEALKANAKLSEKQERLLMRYVDSELGWLGKWQVERLLTNNELAKNFVSSLRLTSDHTRSALVQTPMGASGLGGSSVDLWERISNRIETEERAEMFLGKRPFPGSDSGMTVGWNMFQWKSGALIGAPVGAGLAVLALFLTNGNSSGRMENPGGVATQVIQVADNQVGAIQPGQMQLAVKQAAAEIQRSSSEPSLRTEALNTPPIQLVSNGAVGDLNRNMDVGPSGASVSRGEPEYGRPVVYQDPMEVDWLRSDGRIRMINNQDRRNAIIWIKRANPAQAANKSRSASGNVRENSLRVMQPNVIQQNTPTAITVGNR